MRNIFFVKLKYPGIIISSVSIKYFVRDLLNTYVNNSA